LATSTFDLLLDQEITVLGPPSPSLPTNNAHKATVLLEAIAS